LSEFRPLPSTARFWSGVRDACCGTTHHCAAGDRDDVAMAPTTLRSPIRVLAVAAFPVATLPCSGAAEDAQALPSEQGTSIWIYSLYKAITYETAATLADIPLYATVLAGAEVSTGAFTAVNVAMAVSAYYAYEVGWHFYGPPIGGTPAQAVRTEIEKTLLYRVVSSACNVALGYAFTGSYGATWRFVVVNNVVDSVLYIVNDYGWYRYCPPVAIVWGHGVSLQDVAAEMQISRPAQPQPILFTAMFPNCCYVMNRMRRAAQHGNRDHCRGRNRSGRDGTSPQGCWLLKIIVPDAANIPPTP